MTRVAILVDRENLFEALSSNQEGILEDGFLPMFVWENFNDRILGAIKELSRHESLHHVGTWMFASKRVDLHKEEGKEEIDKEVKFLERMKAIDSLFGFIVRYGMGYKSNGLYHSKGVDVNLVCQMLVGAFEDEYDICVLVSDDDDFIPAVEIVQNFYGKQVYHAGFQGDRLRAACYGNVEFEEIEFRD
ncbi:MAG: NYN domain-containing protein [Saprospiraceae bacterium]|nr:NYN domain-containing protein [Candidatus Vicinibacter affinis]